MRAAKKLASVAAEPGPSQTPNNRRNDMPSPIPLDQDVRRARTVARPPEVGGKVRTRPACPGLREPARQATACFASVLVSLGCLGVLLLAGCQSAQPTVISEAEAGPDVTITLREGDVVKVAFAGTPSLNTTQQIRRDGNINLALVGDVKAAGLTPGALEQEVLRAYGTQLLSREVTVTLESTTFPIFVTGMVLRPGKVLPDRPLTLLEAIMESGGFDPSRANLKAVRVMRREGDRMKTFIVNLKPALAGEPSVPFHLRPADIVYVPERFSLF